MTRSRITIVVLLLVVAGTVAAMAIMNPAWKSKYYQVRATVFRSLGIDLVPKQGPVKVVYKLARSPQTSTATTALIELKLVKDVDARDGRGRTALLYAAEGDNLDAAKRLVQAGANVNARSRDGMSALTLFALAGNAEAIRHLLSKGARAAEVDEAQRLLLFAVQRDDVALARVVLEGTKATVDLTPMLRAAAMSGRIQSARFLLERGANPAVRDWSGTSALDYARANGQPEMIRLLEGGTRTAA